MLLMIKSAFQKKKFVQNCNSTILPIPEQNSTSAARPPELGSWSQYMPPKLLCLTTHCTNYKKISENSSNSHSTELIKVATLTTSSSLLEIFSISWFCNGLMMNKRQHWWNGLQFLFRSLFYTILALWFVFYNLHSTKSSTSQIRLRDKPLPLNIQSLRRSSFIDFGRNNLSSPVNLHARQSI